MTQVEFSQKIKERYPEYQAVDDLELANRMLEKFPSYRGYIRGSSTPEVNPATADARIQYQRVDQFAKSHPVLNFLGKVSGVKDLGRGLGQAIFFNLTKEGRDAQRMLGEGKITADEFEDIVGGIVSPKEVWGSAAQTAITAVLAGSKPGSLVSPGGTIVVGKGAAQLGRSIARTAAKTGSITGLSGGIQSFSEGNSEEKVAADAAAAFGLGALGSGLFNGLIVAPFKAAVQDKATSALFRSGLGFPKNVIKEEERLNRSAADTLIKFGSGTAKQLKERYEKLSAEAEDEIQSLLKGSGKTFSSANVLRSIEKRYAEMFPESLTPEEVAAAVADLPLAALRRSKTVTVGQLNQLRREVTNKMLSPGSFLKQPKEGAVLQLRTSGSVLSDLVKDSVPQSRPVFERYAALIKGVDGALSKMSPTYGPVQTGAAVARLGGSAAAGLAVAGPWGAVIAPLIEEASRTTVGRTSLAVALRKLGGVAGKLGESEINRLASILIKLGAPRFIGGDEGEGGLVEQPTEGNPADDADQAGNDDGL